MQVSINQLPKIDETMPKRELREPKAKARYSPAVLRLAAEHNIRLRISVQGTGLEGRITRKDLLAMIECKSRTADVE